MPLRTSMSLRKVKLTRRADGAQEEKWLYKGQGESFTGPLVLWLNDPRKERRQYADLTRLIESALVLQGEGIHDAKKLANFLQAFNRQSKRFVFRYEAFVSRGMERTMEGATIEDLSELILQPALVPPAQLRKTKRATPANFEWQAFNSLMLSMQRGLLWRVRRCGICKRWFHARKQTTVGCTKYCQRRWQRTTPAAIQERRQRDVDNYNYRKQHPEARRENRTRRRLAASVAIPENDAAGTCRYGHRFRERKDYCIGCQALVEDGTWPPW